MQLWKGYNLAEAPFLAVLPNRLSDRTWPRA